MKKTMKIFVLVLVFCLALCVGALAASGEPSAEPAAEETAGTGFEVNICVNGEEVKSATIGVENEGNIYKFQIGELLDVLGISVSYDEETGIATVTAAEDSAFAAILGEAQEAPVDEPSGEPSAEPAEEEVVAEEPVRKKLRRRMLCLPPTAPRTRPMFWPEMLLLQRLRNLPPMWLIVRNM